MRVMKVQGAMICALLLGCGARTADGTEGLDHGDDGVESGEPSTQDPESTPGTPDPNVPESTAATPNTNVPESTATTPNTNAPPPVPNETQLAKPSKHRPDAIECDQQRPPGNITTDYGGEACTADADCTDGINGRCLDRRGASCTYDECFTDSECTKGGPCGCEMGFWSDANACLGGDCQVDADCGEGGYCSPSFGSCGSYSGVVAYWCRTALDTCVEDSECVDPDRGAGYCAYYPEVGYWACQYGQCVG